MHSSSTRLLAAIAAAAFASAPVSLLAESLDGVAVEVLARSKVTVADRTITYLRIRPPALPAEAGPPPVPVAVSSAAQLRADAIRETKSHVSLAIAVIVHAGSPVITELSWTRPDGRGCRAFSNVDFTHLGQLTELETETTVYDWLSSMSSGDPATLPGGVRGALVAAEPGVQYLFEGDEAEAQADEGTLRAIDYLHAYFQLHQTALIAATALREAEAGEQARRAAFEAAAPKTETVFFWKIENPGDL